MLTVFIGASFFFLGYLLHTQIHAHCRGELWVLDASTELLKPVKRLEGGHSLTVRSIAWDDKVCSFLFSFLVDG